MKVISTMPKGKRMFKSVIIKRKNGMRIYRPFWIEPIENNEELSSFIIEKFD